MSAPWYVYVIGILFALPVLAGIAGLGVMVARLCIQWLFDDGSAPGPGAKGPRKGVALKG
jgi:hypothetical protein